LNRKKSKLLFFAHTFSTSFYFSILGFYFVSFAIIFGFVINQIFFSESIFQSATEDSNERQIFDFSAFTALNPTEFSKIDPAFLELFIGFSEGRRTVPSKTVC
jgi:hypothetical protein